MLLLYLWPWTVHSKWPCVSALHDIDRPCHTMMDKEIKKKYDYEFNTPFDLEKVRDPRRRYGSGYCWWENCNKSLGNMVMSREVRETFMSFGLFPLFAAPELLDKQQFHKFCRSMDFYAVPFSTSYPDNYLPMKYRDNPEEWEEYKRQENEERRVSFYDDEEPPAYLRVKQKDSNEAAAVESPHMRQRAVLVEALSKAKDSSISSSLMFSNLDENVRSVIAAYLVPVDWCRLRTTCRDSKEWPVPTINYDFIYFAISNGWNLMWHGVAHTLKDIQDALISLHKTASGALWIEDCEVTLHVDIVKFDRDTHPIAPLMTFEARQFGKDMSPACIHELGKHYFGVKCAFSLQSFDARCNCFFVKAPDDPVGLPVIDDNFHCLLIRFSEKTPKSRMNLEHIGIRNICCSYCGRDSHCVCHPQIFDADDYVPRFAPKWIGPGGESGYGHIIFYSPTWFGNGSNRMLCSGPEGQAGKTWIIFECKSE